MNESGQPLRPTKAKTPAGNLKFEIESKIMPMLAHDPNHPDLKNPKWFVSMLDPWPEWALRLAAEILSVHFPRVKKRNILNMLKFFHCICFEMETDCDLENSPLAKYDLSDFPEDALNEMISAVAHMQKHAEVQKVKLETAKTKSEIWSEEDEKNLQKMQKGYEQMGEALLKLLGEEAPEKQMPTMGNAISAYNATYDKEGRTRDTTATVVYKQILKSWPEVQNLADTQALCDFLDPVLGHGDAEAKLDRVKKIVKRMGIEFRPRQGTTPQTGLSLQ